MPLLLALLCVCLLALPARAADDTERDRYSRFIHLMHDKHYEQAVEFAFARAKAGDGWARTQVENWNNGSADPDEAPPEVTRLLAARLNKAAQQGDAESQFVLGMRALQSGDTGRLREAVGWLNKAADQGHAPARYVLGSMSRKALDARGIQSPHAGKLTRE